MKTYGDGMNLPINVVMEQCLNKGFTQNQINDGLDTYEALNVIQINATRTNITFCRISDE